MNSTEARVATLRAMRELYECREATKLSRAIDAEIAAIEAEASVVATVPADEPEGEEAREREAARVTYWNENTVICSKAGEIQYVAGWLARAKVKP